MKRFSLILITAIIVMLSACSCSAQAKIFKEAASIEGVTSVYISPFMLKMAGSMTDDLGNGLDDAVKEIKGLEIISCEKASSIPRVKAICEPILAKMGLEVVTEVTEDDEKVTIYAKVIPETTDAEIIVVETSEPGEYNLIYIKGRIDLTQIDK